MQFNRATNYFFVLIWMGYIIATGVHLFSKGFLLTRISQTNFTECQIFETNAEAEDPTKEVLKNLNDVSHICFPKKAKVVFLLIDALRYDFGVYNNKKEPLPFENKLPIMHELLVRQEDRTRLLKFIADPPTTTLQRLKGMMTGSLPTFIDIGSNFASPEINEDNLIDQIVRHNKSAVFMGDGTWTELFPNRFLRQYDYPSFDIFDLDTVDNAIKEHLPKELEKNDWDILIAHFLGVDHCGHKYGPTHPEMGRKLSEMDQVIRDVVEKIDDETVLIVAGDHGMTATGDHGGETIDEVSALLFMYSKNRAFVPNYLEFSQALNQIDIVPVISTILGIPLPYSNLGVIHFNLIPDAPLEGFPRHQWLLMHLWQNARQIQEYFLKYASATNAFNAATIEALKNTFLTFSYRVHSIKTETGFINFAKDLKRYLHDVNQICRDEWIKFDPNQISQGLVITVTATFLIFIIINYLSIFSFESVFSTDLVIFIYVSNFTVGFLGYMFRNSFGSISKEHAIIFSTNVLSLGILAYIIQQNWPSISENLSKTDKFTRMPLRFLFIFSCFTFFSNSFVIYEQKILLYLLISIIIYTTYELKSCIKVKLTHKTKLKNLLRTPIVAMIATGICATIVIFLAQYYFTCREEHGNCINIKTPTMKEDDKTTHRMDIFDLLPLVAVACMVVAVHTYLRACGNLIGFSLNVACLRYGTTVAAVCTGLHFALTKSNISHNVPQFHIDALAWIVYLIMIIQCIILLIDPLLLYVLPNQTDAVEAYEEYIVPALFNKMKQGFNQEKGKPKIPIVCGLATVYSASFLAIGATLAILFGLLLGPNATTGFFLIIVAAFMSILINAVIRYETSSTLVTCLQPNMTMIIVWFLFAHFAFYASSHQPTLSQIDWKAAFVGRSANHDHSIILSAFLVILNTFSGVIWFGILYPLIIMGPFFFYARDSKDENTYRTVTVNKNENYLPIKEIDFDITRGEVNLYENEKRFIAAAFKTAVLLFVLQGIRIFCSMMACTVHCRHLMVWKIFAPRFIYEGLTTYLSFGALSVGFLLLYRVQSAVNYFIDNIDKKIK